MAQYLANQQSETGDILEYREEPGLAYVAGDITAAYPADRVERVTRELAFVDNRYLIVLDRVGTRREGLVPKVLWHTPLAPRIEQRTSDLRWQRNGARVIVTTLLPQQPRLEWVEGFVAGGKTISVAGELKPGTEMGAGRIEVSRSGGNSRNYLFLHVMDIADSADVPGQVRVFSGP